MTQKNPLFALTTDFAIIVGIVAAVLTATTIIAQAGWSKELTTVVVITGFVLAASLAAAASTDG